MVDGADDDSNDDDDDCDDVDDDTIIRTQTGMLVDGADDDSNDDEDDCNDDDDDTIMRTQTGMLAGLNPMLQQWMVSTTLQYLSTFWQTHHLPASQVQHYIRRGSSAAPTTTTTTTAAATSVGGKAQEAGGEKAEKPVSEPVRAMEVDSPPRETAPRPVRPTVQVSLWLCVTCLISGFRGMRLPPKPVRLMVQVSL